MTETKKTRKPRPAAVYPDVPSSISAINNDYIKAYIADNFKKGNLTRKELEALNKRYTALSKEFPAPAFFHHFRKEFAEKYFPQLVAKKAASQESFSDFISGLLDNE